MDVSTFPQPIVHIMQVEIVGLADRLVALRRQLERCEWLYLSARCQTLGRAPMKVGCNTALANQNGINGEMATRVVSDGLIQRVKAICAWTNWYNRVLERARC